jgi:hypothetical protein
VPRRRPRTEVGVQDRDFSLPGSPRSCSFRSTARDVPSHSFCRPASLWNGIDIFRGNLFVEWFGSAQHAENAAAGSYYRQASVLDRRSAEPLSRCGTRRRRRRPLVPNPAWPIRPRRTRDPSQTTREDARAASTLRIPRSRIRSFPGLRAKLRRRSRARTSHEPPGSTQGQQPAPDWGGFYPSSGPPNGYGQLTIP